MKRSFPILMGVVGVAILLSLGVWQLQRLAWKVAVLDRIGLAIASGPLAIPQTPSQQTDTYLAVEATGRATGEEIAVFAALPDGGPGYRIIAVFEETGLDGTDLPARRLLLDLGYATAERRAAPFVADNFGVVGNLHWPDEADSWTPDQPDTAGLWYARDVDTMAVALNTEPVMVVVREARMADTGTPLGTILVPLTTTNIKNDHLNYAITWFLLAAVWAAMSAYLVSRTRKAT